MYRQAKSLTHPRGINKLSQTNSSKIVCELPILFQVQN